MRLQIDSTWTMVGFGLVLGSMILSWVVALALGGFKVGHLEKRITIQVGVEQWAAFLETIHRRLAELGFRHGDAEGVFIQDGSVLGDVTTFTHAKTRKQFEIISHENGTQVTAEISLRYLEFIASDSGESAYRDAVLDYVSGNKNDMKVVPNQSFGALSCFTGGIVACLAVMILKLIQFKILLPPIIMLTAAEVSAGVMGIIAIRRRRDEITGLWLALSGIGLCALATLAALVLQVLEYF